MKSRNSKKFIMYISLIVALIVLVILFLPFNCPKDVKLNQHNGASIDTVLVIDGSGSMNDFTNTGDDKKITKYQAAKKASLEIISIIDQEKEALRLDSKLGYIEFSGIVSETFKLNSSTDKIRDYLKGADDRFAFGTNLGSGISKALELFKESNNKNKIMIVLSDGRSNTGLTNRQVLEDLIPKAKEQGIKIYTIGFDANPDKLTDSSEVIDPVFLYNIAKGTDGKYYYSTESLDLSYSFSNLYHQATGSIITSTLGDVAKDKPKIAKLVVPCSCGGLRLTLNSQSSSNLKIKLLSPEGNIINDNDHRLSATSVDGFSNVFYNNPAPGEWQAQISYDGVDDKPVEFYLSGSVTAANSSYSISAWLSDRLWLVILLMSLSTVALSCLSNLLLSKNNQSNDL